MKKFCLLLVVAGLFLLPVGRAEAIAPFYAKFEAKYAGADAKPEWVTLVKETKCFVCHVKGEEKKVRNEYGEALKKAGLLKATYTADHVKTPEAEKEIFAILEKVAAEKGATGTTYGEALKAGKLPGAK